MNKMRPAPSAVIARNAGWVEGAAFDPALAGLLSAIGVVFEADSIGDLIEKLAWGL